MKAPTLYRALVSLALIALAPLLSQAHADCLDDAAATYRLDPQLVRAIAIHESGMKPNAVNRNSNGSVDVGLMQINSSWFPTLARSGIEPQRLFDACVNAYVGAWILSSNIERFGPTWKAVGAYNASTPSKQLRYANQIYARWQSLQLARPKDTQ